MVNAQWATTSSTSASSLGLVYMYSNPAIRLLQNPREESITPVDRVRTLVIWTKPMK